jgi:hypothetical protein
LNSLQSSRASVIDRSGTAPDLEVRRHIPPALSDASQLSLGELTPETLRRIAAEHGIDAATAFAFDRVCQSSQHAAFIRRVDALQSASCEAALPPDFLIGIVPAAFYREMPHTGADGRVLRETASRLGLQVETIPIRSTGTLAENAASIHDWLARQTAGRIILISLCKGGADLKHALRGNAGAFQRVVAWINVCGTLDGSPFAAWLLKSKPRFIATWLYFKCQRRNFEMLREIVPASNGPLARPLALPSTLRLISVVGFPLRGHLTNAFMRRCHRFIAAAGPNDGGVLLADAVQLPGLLYPVWGADHYLRPDARASAVLAAVLRYLAETRSPASTATGAAIASLPR